MTTSMWLIGLLCVALAGAGLWLMRLPAGYRVERVQRFARTADFMQAYLLDYPRWQDWSPWLLHDPQTDLHFFGQAGQLGSGYGWQSQSIGQGEIRTDAIKPGQSTALTLEFMKPFKSQAQVFFEFHKVANDPTACELRWVMDAKVPLPMRPFLPMFEHMIGMDFDLGLARMVGALDSSAPHPRISFLGVCTRPAQSVITRNFSGPMAGLPGFFAKAFPELAAQAGGSACGEPAGIYHQISIKDHSTRCDAALPVTDAYAGADIQSMGGGKFYQVRLQGDYRFLAPAWNAAMGHARMQRHKLQKRRPPLEVYIKRSDTVTNSNDLVTDLLVPIR